MSNSCQVSCDNFPENKTGLSNTVCLKPLVMVPMKKKLGTITNSGEQIQIIGKGVNL